MTGKIAIFILKNTIETLFFDACPAQFRDKSGSVYEKSSSQEDGGFYDWLRTESGTPIGVRWFPHSSQFLGSRRAKYLQSLAGIDIPDAREMTIWFTKFQRAVDVAISGDQDFGENDFSFSIANLSDKAAGALPV